MADPGDFTIEVDELDDVVGDLESCERDLSHLVRDLDRQLAVLQGTWDGLAASAHHEAHREWSSGMAAMRVALADLRAAGRLAHGHYTEAATTNVDMWQQVT